MSARARSARKSTASTFSYAEPASSADEDEGSELDDQDRGAGGRKSNTKAPTKRRKSKAKAVEVDSGDEGDEDDQPRKKARKPAKGKQSKQKKVTGKLEILKTLPIEMLTEIFSHLYPNDLLALSMVNKQYRALLTAKSSTRLWKAARDKLKLPDVSSGNFKEWQYASLLFAKKCQRCNGGKGMHTNASLRVRYCNSCWTSEVVKLSTLKRTHPAVHAKLHPRAQEVVLESYGYVLLSDLQRATVFLRDLEDQDEDSDIAEGDAKPAPTAPVDAGPARRRSQRIFASEKWVVRQDESSDDDDEELSSPFTRRVNAYIAERNPVLAALKEDGSRLRTASWRARRHLYDQRAAAKAALRKNLVWRPGSRSNVLKKKIMALGLGFVDSDFYHGGWDRSKLVTSSEPVTDDEWDVIKPKLIKLLERERKKAVQERALDDQRAKQRKLRPRYDALKSSLPDSARPFAPLFLDFLLLSSVKALWAGDDDVTAQAWADALDDIKDELEQFRLDLVIHARDVVLEATTDPDKRSAPINVDDLGEDDLDLDAFFSLATSFVCCGVKGCKKSRRRYNRYRAYGGALWDEAETARISTHLGAIGPLVDVLEHMHKHHDKNDEIDSKRAFKAQPQFHISLPLEVACATSAILEVNQLDPSTAGLAELKHAERMVRGYTWENRPAVRRSCWGQNAWFELLYLIKTQGDKLSRMKPPIFLDPPLVVLHPRRTPFPADSDAADAKSEVNDDKSSPAWDVTGHDIFGDSEDDEDMSGDSEDW